MQDRRGVHLSTSNSESLEAYEQALDAYRLAADALDGGGQTNNESAVVHLTRALELDPEFAAAWADLAISYHYEYYSNWIEAPEDVLNHCFQYSQKAVELDDADSKCRYALAWSYGRSPRDRESGSDQ